MYVVPHLYGTGFDVQQSRPRDHVVLRQELPVKGLEYAFDSCTSMSQNPFDLLKKEFPELAEKYDSLVESQRALKGLDPKTKQLINIAIQTSTRNPRGVKFHSIMAKQDGASRAEVLGAVVMNLHLAGLAVVLDSLPSAIDGYDGKW